MAAQPVVRLGDMSAGACGFPPIPCQSTSVANVFVNGIPVVTVGDFWGIHCNSDTCHPEVAVMGNPTVLVNGKPLVTVGSSLSSGDMAASGSPNVFA